jgi:hypothetical protein
MKRNEMKKTGKRNHYAIVTFFPERMTGTTLFLFEDGRYFTDEDMEDYIYWFVSGHRSFVDEIKLRVTIEECEEIKKKDAYVDWNYCSWGFFKNLRTTGAFYNNNKSKQEDIVTSSSTH